MSDRWAYAIAVIGGAGLWLATALISGRTEAWDSSLYWMATYPLSIALAGILGYGVPARPWRWGIAVMLAQAVALAIAGASFTLLPLGLILFSVLALPAAGFARVTARLRLRNDAPRFRGSA